MDSVLDNMLESMLDIMRTAQNGLVLPASEPELPLRLHQDALPHMLSDAVRPPWTTQAKLMGLLCTSHMGLNQHATGLWPQLASSCRGRWILAPQGCRLIENLSLPACPAVHVGYRG